MDENRNELMKVFSLVFKDRAKSETEYREIHPEIAKFISRKELIEIITQKIYNGEIPEDMNLVEMENQDLLEIIGDDMFIISYVTEKWSENAEFLPTRPEHPYTTAQRVRKEKLAQKRNKAASAESEAVESEAPPASDEKKESDGKESKDDKKGKKGPASDPSETKTAVTEAAETKT